MAFCHKGNKCRFSMQTESKKSEDKKDVYLCVIHESSSSVTWPDLNISQPAWAIIAPLSMQNLLHKVNSVLSGLDQEHNVPGRLKSQFILGTQQWRHVMERKHDSLLFSQIHTRDWYGHCCTEALDANVSALCWCFSMFSPFTTNHLRYC